MKWALAGAALVILANGLVLVSTARERSGPVTRTAVLACDADLRGGPGSNDPPGFRLTMAPESLTAIPGLDSAGLVALGFDRQSVAAVGRTRDTTFRWRRPRPAWVRLRQTGEADSRFMPVEVAARREQLVPDSATIIVRGLIGIREHLTAPVVAPPPAPGGGHDHATVPPGYVPGILVPAVNEVIPHVLHLDRGQIAALRAALPDSAGCAPGKLVIASGRRGGLWVEAVE
jgi:hypothetical protein